ncbi:MAG: PilZ domain-containing protein [Candidatus Omnitrophota bacterium]|nr:PilZ domain-containing protein [Candidatus Omnitrophota bacterium]
MAEFLTQDKRQDLRLKEALPVRFKWAEQKFERSFDAQTEDISLSGAFIKIEIEKKILGKKVLIEIVSSPIGSMIATPAEVVWVKEEKGRILGVGVKFVEVDETKREEILKLVLEKLFPPRETKITFKAINRKLSEKETRGLEILDLIRRDGPVSVSNIAQAIGVNVVTTTNYLKDYLKKELLIDCGEDVSTGGRRPNLMALNPRYGFCIGLEINHQANLILGVLVDLTSKIVAKVKENLTSDTNINQRSVEIILRLIKNSQADREKILGIALGIDSATNVEPLKEYIEKKVNLPVLSQRSCQVGVFAEKWLNMDLSGIDNLVYLDSTEHCSLVIDGKIYLGSTEEAGWIHSPRPNIKEDLFCLISLLNPQAIVISKKLIEQKEDFLKIIREDIRKALSRLSKLPTVIASTLGEDTVVLAVCSLAVREIFMQV